MKLLRLSIPVKVLLSAVVVYAFLFALGEVLWVWGIHLSQVWVTLEIIAVVAVTLLFSSVLYRRHLAERESDVQRVLKSLTQLSSEKAKAEQALKASEEQCRQREQRRPDDALLANANRKLAQLVRDLKLIYDIGQQVNSVIDLDRLYVHMTDILRRSLEIEEFAIMIFDEERQKMHVRAASGFTDDERVLRTIFRVGEGISGLAAQTGRKIYIRDTSQEKRFLHYKGERLTLASSFLSIPLLYKGEVQGVINFGRHGVGAFTSHDVKMLELVAHQVALAIANARLYTKTRELSVRDELTGIYNRRHFQQVLQMEWKRAVRFRRDLSIIMLDVDHFKNYNDTFGHLEGDRVLRSLGALFLKNLREVDTVARFGGEEFVFLLPDTDKHGAMAVAEKVRRLVEEQHFGSDDRSRTITISAGLATFPDDVGEMEDLVDFSDIALYRAKEQGRNCVVCYSTPTIADEAEPPPKVTEGQPKKKDRPLLQ